MVRGLPDATRVRFDDAPETTEGWSATRWAMSRDEVGYVPVDPQVAALMFIFISRAEILSLQRRSLPAQEPPPRTPASPPLRRNHLTDTPRPPLRRVGPCLG